MCAAAGKMPLESPLVSALDQTEVSSEVSDARGTELHGPSQCCRVICRHPVSRMPIDSGEEIMSNGIPSVGREEQGQGPASTSWNQPMKGCSLTAQASVT